MSSPSAAASSFKRRMRWLGIAFSVVAFVLLAIVAWLWSRLQGSLPQLDGSVAVAGLKQPVGIERDALGIPTLRGESRLDVARALGFVHGQDRFFQMDLSRRRAAGELAELFGPGVLHLDRGARMHEFRALAKQVIAQGLAEEKALLEAYAEGVNAGLRSIGRPWEYAVLRVDPVPWTPEDSALCLYAMALDLQDETGRYERHLNTLRDVLGPAAVAYFAPLLSPDDAALDDSTAPVAPVPSARVIQLRTAGATSHSPVPAPTLATAASATWSSFPWHPPESLPEIRPGSNSFGLAGLPGGRAALLENDMHLSHSVPTVWYRARFLWPRADDPSRRHDINGVTLPGAPAMVVGSNGSIAWGFTSSNVDTGDLVLVQPDTVLPERLYGDGRGPAEFEFRTQTIRVKGQPDETLTTKWTVWGPVVGETTRKRPLALKWTLRDPSAANFRLLGLETATTVPEAIALAHDMGVPAANFLVADRDGRLAWTIAGKLPRRYGHDGRLPVPWAYGDRGWNGYLPSSEVPVVYAEPGAALWSANQRMVGGAALEKLGDGGYDPAPRARRIRDLVKELAARPADRAPTAGDLLDVALDIRNPMLDRWQRRLLEVLTPAATANHPGRAALRRQIETWEGRADPASRSYPLVRSWRLRVADRALTPLFASCREASPDFNYRVFQVEHPLWNLLEQKPLHLLAPSYGSWEDLLLAAADDVLADLERNQLSVETVTWGRSTTLRMRHPFSYSLPAWIGTFLDMPAEPLPGDSHLPRAQSSSDGASQRFVVSPGREQEGILHMPGGQSGHPLSPYYRAGHQAWVSGQPTPLLPGPPAHTLTLQPIPSPSP